MIQQEQIKLWLYRLRFPLILVGVDWFIKFIILFTLDEGYEHFIFPSLRLTYHIQRDLFLPGIIIFFMCILYLVFLIDSFKDDSQSKIYKAAINFKLAVVFIIALDILLFGGVFAYINPSNSSGEFYKFNHNLALYYLIIGFSCMFIDTIRKIKKEE